METTMTAAHWHRRKESRTVGIRNIGIWT